MMALSCSERCAVVVQGASTALAAISHISKRAAASHSIVAALAAGAAVNKQAHHQHHYQHFCFCRDFHFAASAQAAAGARLYFLFCFKLSAASWEGFKLSAASWEGLLALVYSFFAK